MQEFNYQKKMQIGRYMNRWVGGSTLYLFEWHVQIFMFFEVENQ